MQVDKREALRYLGYGSRKADGETLRLLEEVAQELERHSLPKSIYREYECQVAGGQVTFGSLSISSQSLAENLRGCRHVVLLAATIGRGADMMIKKYSVSNLAKAAVAQAAGAACIEAYIDEIESLIRTDAQKRGLCLRPRFSPGYGDFPLECQKRIFAMLECPKRIGVTLTAGNLMVPSKSVSALIGLAPSGQESCRLLACSQCKKEDCEFRRGEDTSLQKNQSGGNHEF